MEPVLARLGKTAGVDATWSLTHRSDTDRGGGDDSAAESCEIRDPAGDTAWITVTKSKADLNEHLHDIDRTVVLAALIAIGAALVAAVGFARTLGRPIEELASEARKVAAGAARPLRVRGTGEVADLTAAFDRMLDDLEATRRRLAATSRVAAWREVARRVAHEVKNPLAPIRAAVETLRRLRARDDPRFDEYFDEATRTVLDEVHRIVNIVTEFTRFARLPPPTPVDVDVVELARGVLALQKARAPDVRLETVVRGGAPPHVLADRDQVVQVLTNLVQNALDAVNGKGEVLVTIEATGAARDRVAVTIADDGPGIAPEIAARLFEPYATNKAQGTGLGLAIAQRIAIEHDGELSYVARTGASGATFRLVLPVAGPPPVSDMPPSSSS